LLLGLTLPLYEKGFRDTATKLGCTAFGVTPHVLRHSGPSNDILNNNITIAGVMARGRWSLGKSVRRYQKSGRLLLRAQRLNSILSAKVAAANRSFANQLVRAASAGF
jgi:hypothetical protein